MDKNTKDLLCGLVLGDGTVHKRGKRFQMQHSIKQLEYLKYKVSLLKEVGFELEFKLLFAMVIKSVDVDFLMITLPE